MATSKIKKPNLNHFIIDWIASTDDTKMYAIGLDIKKSEKYNHVHFTCSCPRFKFSSKDGVEPFCKHVKTFVKHNSILEFSYQTPLSPNKLTLSEIFNKRIKFNLNTEKFELGSVIDANKYVTGLFKQSAIVTILKTITCPSLFCGHIIKGSFQENTLQTCPKCQERFFV